MEQFLNSSFSFDEFFSLSFPLKFLARVQMLCKNRKKKIIAGIKTVKEKICENQTSVAKHVLIWSYSEEQTQLSLLLCCFMTPPVMIHP